jgi:repressor LexA
MKRTETFQNRLKDIMNERHINQTELSKRTNITRTAISSYYNGAAEPNAEKILILSLTLGVEPLWLMGFDVPRNKSTLNEITTILESKSEDELRRAKEVLLLMFKNN